MPLTWKLTPVCDYLLTLIETNMVSLGVKAVFYGDQERLPVTPTVCIEPDQSENELKAARRFVGTTIRVYILIYHSKISSVETNRRGSDLMAEAIADLIHTEPTLAGLVIHGFVKNISSGYVNRERTVVRTSRITYEALSQAQLPS